MLDRFHATNNVDQDGNPAGGAVIGMGLTINWQNGPLGRDGERKEPNGAFVETVIAAAMQRLEFYEQARGGRFSCGENRIAIDALREALLALDQRTKLRESRQVEGTHQA